MNTINHRIKLSMPPYVGVTRAVRLMAAVRNQVSLPRGEINEPNLRETAMFQNRPQKEKKKRKKEGNFEFKLAGPGHGRNALCG